MSETQNPREDETKGTFVGGSFGKPSLDKDSHEQTTAQQVEADEDEHGPAVAAPAEVQETIDDASTSSIAASDVEGTGTEPAPGERNEPV